MKEGVIDGRLQYLAWSYAQCLRVHVSLKASGYNGDLSRNTLWTGRHQNNLFGRLLFGTYLSDSSGARTVLVPQCPGLEALGGASRVACCFRQVNADYGCILFASRANSQSSIVENVRSTHDLPLRNKAKLTVAQGTSVMNKGSDLLLNYLLEYFRKNAC